MHAKREFLLLKHVSPLEFLLNWINHCLPSFKVFRKEEGIAGGKGPREHKNSVLMK